MNPETGRIHVRPAGATDQEWAAFCEAHGLTSMTADEYAKLARLSPSVRASLAAKLKTFDPAKQAAAKAIEARRKEARRAKNKAARAARKR